MNGKRLRIVFMGTPEFAATCLETLLEGRHEVVGVVTAPDRESGRGRKISQSEVKKLALEKGLPIEQPVKLREEGFLEVLKGWNADLGVVVAFRMLPDVVWAMPQMGTVNLHGSLLPQFRGAAPIQRAIMAGATESGATTFLLSHDIDTGDVLGQVRLDIGADENAGSLHDRVLEAGKHLLAETVDHLAEGVAQVKPQSEYDLEASERLEAPKLFKADRKIDWHQSSKEVHNLIRGLSPSPGAITYLPESENAPIKILSATPSEKTGLAPGQIHISENRFTVGTKDGSLEVKRIQPPGKGAMDIGDFLRGARISLGNFVS